MNYSKLKRFVSALMIMTILLSSVAFAAYAKLEKGDKGADVLSMQLALASLGYDLDADGSYGAGTKEIVAQFQADQKLEADGVAGDKTLTRLYQLAPAYAPGVSSGSSSSSSSSATAARVQTTGGTLTLRKSQSTSAAALQYIPNLTVLSILEKGSKWCKTTYGGQTGYVLTSYLSFTVSSATATPTKAPTSGSVGTSSTTARVQTTGGTLTLRKSQSTSAAALQYIPNLTVLSILEKGSKWCKATYNGDTGYVLTSYLNFSAAPTATPTATPKPNTSTTYQAQVRTTGGTLSLRETRSTNSTALKLIPNLTVLTVTDKGSTWCTTSYDGRTGYVLTKYLNFSSIITNTATPTPTPTPTKTPSGGTVGGLTATVRTTGGTLTLRKSQSTSAAALKYIPNGTVLTLLDTGDKWCQAMYDGAVGYVLTSYLVFGGSTATATPTKAPETGMVYTARVTTSGGTLNLRQSASQSAKVLTEIPNGTYLTVTSKGGTWCQTAYNGFVGYVMTNYLTFTGSQEATPSPTPTQQPQGTATPTPTPTPAYDTSIFTRVLRSGYTGQDVTLTQQRLKELNYLSSVSGTYDAETMAAVKQFQKLHNLTSDGLAGSSTFTALFSDSAMEYSPSMDNYKTLRIYYGSVDSSLTSDVTRLQTSLKNLGYSVSVTGKFDEATHNAVVQFQLRNGLTVDGAAGASTQFVLFSGKAKDASAMPSYELESGAGQMSAPSKSEIKLLHWFNVVKPSLSGGSRLLIYDPNTGLSWTLRVYARGNHADSEPLTLRDTLIMNKSFGKTNWTVHPVYVQLPDGRWTMATMHNRPHLTGSISANGFDGHLCVHFLRDMAECKLHDPNYGVSNQTTLRTAWKNLTGETVD